MLRVIGHIVSAGCLHGVQNGVLGMMRRRGGLAFGQLSPGQSDFIALLQIIRKRSRFLIVLFRSPSADAAAEGLPDPLPAHLQDFLSLELELTPCTGDSNGRFVNYKRLIHGAEEPCADQRQQIPHAGRQ